MSTSERDAFCPLCLKIFWNKKDRDNHVAVIHRRERKERTFLLHTFKEVLHAQGWTWIPPKSVSFLWRCSGQVYCLWECFGHDMSLKRHMKIHDEDAELFRCHKWSNSFLRKDQPTRNRGSVYKIVNFYLTSVDSLKNDYDKYTCKVCERSFTGSDAKDLFV